MLQSGARPNFSPFICSCGKDHTPKSIAKRKEIRYWMFDAAFQGCLPCVQYCIETLGVDAQIESLNQNYTVVSWAEWGREKHVPGTEEVVVYLASLAVQQ